MRLYIYILWLFTFALCFISCEDYLDTHPKTILKNDKYIAEDEEMFKGFLNIMTKMQAAGDHAIFLTDTRGHYLEVTGNAPLELQQIYNYEATDGNSYADPACYYAIVDACNDFIFKMKEYREKEGDNMTEASHKNFNRLISYTLRVKVWTYLTIGKIYGEALWFDEPLYALEDLNNTAIFSKCDMQAIVTKGLELLDNGIVLYNDEQIPAREYDTMVYNQNDGTNVSYNMLIDWAAWINPESPDDAYDYMNYLVPPWMILRCDLISWRGTQADYEWIRDNVLTFLYQVQSGEFPYIANHKEQNQPAYFYASSHRLRGSYPAIFYTERYGIGAGYIQQNIAGIMYDYENRQTNRLVEYFANEGSGKYFLRPSSYAIQQYIPTDLRGMNNGRMMHVIKNDTCFTKYFYSGSRYLRTNIVEIQPVIPLYRGQDYHYLLAEAENNLGNWKQTDLLLNNGIPSLFSNNVLTPDWDPRYACFLERTGYGGYANLGIIGALRGKFRELPYPDDDGKFFIKDEFGQDVEITEEARMKIYDLALLDEALLEYTGEGRSYAMMVRLAEKWNDPSIVADRVCPKYPVADQARIRSLIMNKEYWVHWNLHVN